jgi:hypothetical protein
MNAIDVIDSEISADSDDGTGDAYTREAEFATRKKPLVVSAARKRALRQGRSAHDAERISKAVEAKADCEIASTAAMAAAMSSGKSVSVSGATALDIVTFMCVLFCVAL